MSRPRLADLIADKSRELDIGASDLARVAVMLRLVEAEHGPDLPWRSQVALGIALKVLRAAVSVRREPAQ